MSHPPGVFRCMWCLAACDMALRVFGFGRVLRAARRLGAASTRAFPRDLIERTLYNVAVATAFYPGRSKCLEQSVASFILLRRRGVPVDVRLGVQPYPFVAHAWLELNGEPISESPEIVARFALMPDPAL